VLQYAYQPMDYDATYATVRGALLDGVFGPPKQGVYSPSVQYTLYQMAHMALQRAPQVWGWGRTGGQAGGPQVEKRCAGDGRRRKGLSADCVMRAAAPA
jgi:hypothetical protein